MDFQELITVTKIPGYSTFLPLWNMICLDIVCVPRSTAHLR